jgi:hypothetical protein
MLVATTTSVVSIVVKEYEHASMDEVIRDNVMPLN